jgi:hypothetical protein
MIAPGGVVSTLAGLPGTTGSSDGSGIAALFNDPIGIAVDGAGNLYVADRNNSTIRIGVPPIAPEITGPTATEAAAGQAFSYTIVSGVPATSFAATSLPPGLSLNAATGAITGSVTVPGTYPIGISATNAFGTATGSLTLTVVGQSATVAIGNLSQTYDGTSKSAIVTTNPTGLPATVTYNGSPTPPTIAGTYSVVATAGDANSFGVATGTLVIAQAQAGVAVDGTTVPYTGGIQVPSVTTTPTGLGFTLVSTPAVEPIRV